MCKQLLFCVKAATRLTLLNPSSVFINNLTNFDMMLFLNIMLVSVVWSNLQAQKFRKGDEDILPYLSPRSSRPPSRYRPRSAPADRQYNDSYEADVSIIFKWGFFSEANWITDFPVTICTKNH
jgi:hypothetical protein